MYIHVHVCVCGRVPCDCMPKCTCKCTNARVGTEDHAYLHTCLLESWLAHIQYCSATHVMWKSLCCILLTQNIMTAIWSVDTGVYACM